MLASPKTAAAERAHGFMLGEKEVESVLVVYGILHYSISGADGSTYKVRPFRDDPSMKSCLDRCPIYETTGAELTLSWVGRESHECNDDRHAVQVVQWLSMATSRLHGSIDGVIEACRCRILL